MYLSQFLNQLPKNQPSAKKIANLFKLDSFNFLMLNIINFYLILIKQKQVCYNEQCILCRNYQVYNLQLYGKAGFITQLFIKQYNLTL
jgi:hypothetical protein